MATKKDIVTKLKLAQSIVPLLRTADVNGSGVDTQDSVSVGAIVHMGASGDTLSGSVKIEFALQESDDNSSFSACADADVSGAIAGAAQTGTFAVVDAPGEASAVYKGLYIGIKRYVRVIGNLVGTHTNGSTFGAMIVLEASVQPAA